MRDILTTLKERPFEHVTWDNVQEAIREIERLRSDFAALQTALVGATGLSAIQEAHKLRAMHPLTSQ